MAVITERQKITDFSQVSLRPDPEVARRMQNLPEFPAGNESRYIHPALALGAILTGGAALYLTPTLLKVIETIATK